MQRIPEHKIDEIRSLADVVEVVGDYVQLKKRGTNFIGLCPFHGEKTPSFNVNPQRQIFKCFGCGKGGDAIKFISEIENISYGDALKLLANKYHIELPKFENPDYQKEQEFDAYYEALSFAARFFYRALIQTEKGKSRALSYFTARHLSPETIKTFGLGYAPDAWDGLLQAAEKQGIKVSTLEAVGLILPKKNESEFYDRFRNRAMFPIFSHIGKVIGFGGRILVEDKTQPKYINSPETVVYQKSKVLYGLSHAKNEIRGKNEVLLTEGYTDVISLYQAGVKNVVSSSGTALTVEQIKLLSRYTKNILLLYDADQAGMNAAIRGMDLIFQQGLSVQLVALPSGHDPDSYVREFGGDAFRAYIAQHKSNFLEFVLSDAKKRNAWASPEEKTSLVRQMMGTIALMPDTLMRDGYLQSASILLRVPEMDLRQELEKLRKGKKEPIFSERVATPLTVSTSEREKHPIYTPQNPPKLHPSERILLELMLAKGMDLVGLILERVSIDSFSEGVSQQVATILLSQYESGTIKVDSFLAGEMGEALQAFVADLLTERHELSPRWKEKLKTGIPVKNANATVAALDAIKELQMYRVQTALEMNRKAVYEAEQSGADDQQLLQQQVALLQLRKQLSESST